MMNGGGRQPACTGHSLILQNVQVAGPPQWKAFVCNLCSFYKFLLEILRFYTAMLKVWSGLGKKKFAWARD